VDVQQSEERAFRLHLPGLLRVLAEHLYSQKSVAVRELLQNAHDSCVRRSVEEVTSGYRPRIDVIIDRRRSVLVIADNGSGLTYDEVVEYLATIGRSYTRDLKERLALFSSSAATKLVGQFGLGFLSAFLVAEDVTVLTRSTNSGGQAVRFNCGGDEHYTVEPGERREIGTTVELRLKPSASFLLQTQIVAETIRKYADFLPTPIYLDGDPFPVNVALPPWGASEPAQAVREDLERRFGVAAPLCIVPLHDGRIDLGHDAVTVPLRGYLFIPPGSVVSVREWGDLTVFVRGMFITDADRELLPSWARFARGVIDSSALQPTASREGIHQDDAFALVRHALSDQLGEALRDIARNQPTLWRKIATSHADLMYGWAAASEELFDLVASILPVRTSRGLLTLPELAEQSGDVLYYVTQHLGSLQEQLLAEGHDVPAIDASWFGVLPFVQRYAARHPNLRLSQLDGDISHFLRRVPSDVCGHLVAYYGAKGIQARVATYRPREVPALLIYPKDAELIADGREALEKQILPPGIDALVGDYLGRIQKGDEDVAGTLYLNASSSIVQQLSAAPIDTARLGYVLDILYHLARLFASRMLAPSDATESFRVIAKSLETLL
jgi:molecular chaperone HtpG